MSLLTPPSEKYKESFLQSVQEFHIEGRQEHYDLKSIRGNFRGFVQSLLNEADRTKLKPGRVPASEFWLIDGEEFVGRLSLRHELNDFLLRFGGHIGYEIRPSKRRRGYGKEILRLGLEKARKLGLHCVLVTCDEDNTGSRKIIEYNGGRLENIEKMEGDAVKKLRFWIDIN